MPANKDNNNEPALRETELPADIAGFLNTVPLMLRITAADGTDIWFNRSWLEFTGRKLQDETGGRWLEGVHPEDLVEVKDAIAHAPQGNQQRQFRFRLRRNDGQYRGVSCSRTRSEERRVGKECRSRRARCPSSK